MRARRIAAAIAALNAGCATPAPPLPPPVHESKGSLVIHHLPAEYAPAEGYCWSSTVSSVDREEHVFSEDGCVPSGGVGRSRWLDPGEYMVELVRCAGAECNVERDPSRYPLACPPIRVTVVAGRLTKVREQWRSLDRCVTVVHDTPL